MKKFVSVLVMLLLFSSNFFYFTFAQEDEVITPWDDTFTPWDEPWEISDSDSLDDDIFIPISTGDIDESIQSDTDESTQPDIDLSQTDFSILGSTQIQLEEIQLPDLIISEVYFDWSNEWIEIYNQWDDFSWQITISGASASQKIFNIDIQAQWIVILSDKNVSFITDTQNIAHNDAWFNIKDDDSIDIKIIYSWNILDIFFVDQDIVQSIDPKTSFHKFIDTKNITWTTNNFAQNVSTWYFANPWLVFNESDLWNSDPWDSESWETTWDIDTPDLKITEIYFDWDDNWFEISNIWDQDFSWNLQLSGSINLQIQTQIWIWISKVFANNLDMFQSGNNIDIIPNPINFGSQEINVDLIRSWKILDNFFVHKSWVDYLQWKQSSVEKIGYGQNWTTTRVWFNSDRYYNIVPWYEANPTKYFTYAENAQDVTKDRNWTQIYTWSDYDLPIDCDDFWEDSTASISEVYFGNEIYPSYVELNIVDDISDYYSQIILSWDALVSDVHFSTTSIQNHTRVLLTRDSTWYDEWRASKYNSDFQLKSTWFIVLYGLDWFDRLEILDIIYIPNPVWWNSVYVWSESIECADVFDYQNKFSPWMSIWQSQFVQITPDPVVKYISVWWGWSCTSTQKPTFDTSDTFSNEIQISAIKYYWNYQILKLKNKTNNDINLHEYYLQFLDWSQKNIQWNTLFAKSTMSFVWNYGLATNQDFCVNLMKDGNVVDRYCRNSVTKANTWEIQNIQNQMTFWHDLYPEPDEESEDTEQIATWQNQNFYLKIDNIVYDPEWSDDGKEELWLTSRNLDTIEFGTQFYITVNWTKKSLKNYGSISPWQTKKLVWTFWFPNTKKTTINLFYSWDILDTYTYDPDLDKLVDTWQNLSTWDDNLSGIDLDSLDISIMSVLPNPFWADGSGEEFSLYYSGAIPQINLSSWFYLQIWTTKKYLKWILPANQETLFRWSYSLPNKWWCVEIGYQWYIFDKFCYQQPYEWQKFFISNGVLESLNTMDLSVLNQTKMQNIWNKVCMTYWDQKFYCKTMPYSKLSTKKINQNKLYKEFFDSFENYLKSEWKIMYYDSEIKNYFSLLDDIEDVISEWKSTYELDWQIFQTSEFQAMYDALYHKDPQNFITIQLNSILPNWVVDKYFSLKKQYLDYLYSM